MATNFPVVFTRLSTPPSDQPAVSAGDPSNAVDQANAEARNAFERAAESSCRIAARVKSALNKR